MNYAEIKNCDIANGPGVRVSLFVSGCTHHCPGCFNQVAWDFDYGQPFTQQTIDEILKLLAPGYIKGLTLLGGEPFEPENQPAVVELLSTADEAVARATVGPDGTALMKYLAPGKYYARLFIDANNNGKWDTGKLLSGLQPEEVYYYDKRIDLKGNWDVEQSWDIMVR